MDAAWFYQLRIQAAAAGIDRATFSRMTFSETLIHLEGHKYNHYLANQPLAKLYAKDFSLPDPKVKKMSPREQKQLAELHADLERMILAPVTPAFLVDIDDSKPKAKSEPPVPGLRPEVAEAIMQAMARGRLIPKEWRSKLFRLLGRLRATAG